MKLPIVFLSWGEQHPFPVTTQSDLCGYSDNGEQCENVLDDDSDGKINIEEDDHNDEDDDYDDVDDV